MLIPVFTNPVLIAAAIIPAVVLLISVYRLDKLEKEPVSLLVRLVLLGIFATGMSVFTERLGNVLIPLFADNGTILYNILMNFVVVALSEEGCKYFLLYRSTWHDPAFNCRFDAVVYAVFVSLGFALWENILYVLMYGMKTALVRAITAVPGHACFGVFMGMWYGNAKKYEGYGRMKQCRICQRMTLLIPVLLHGTYDYIASYDDPGTAWVFVIFVVWMFVTAFVLLRRLSKADRYISGYKDVDYWIH